MHVYVSASLRSQMKECDGMINWSEVAAQAFKRAIEQHKEHVFRRKESRRLATNLYNEIIERT